MHKIFAHGIKKNAHQLNKELTWPNILRFPPPTSLKCPTPSHVPLLHGFGTRLPFGILPWNQGNPYTKENNETEINICCILQTLNIRRLKTVYSIHYERVVYQISEWVLIYIPSIVGGIFNPINTTFGGTPKNF